MSNGASELLSIIQKEYNERLNSGINKSKATIFSNDYIIENYNYNPKTLKSLVKELVEYGYIEKWIIPGFKLIVD